MTDKVPLPAKDYEVLLLQTLDDRGRVLIHFKVRGIEVTINTESLAAAEGAAAGACLGWTTWAKSAAFERNAEDVVIRL